MSVAESFQIKNKAEKNKSQSAANKVLKNHPESTSTLRLTDNRPTTIVQKQLQEIAQNSKQNQGIAQLQTKADRHAYPENKEGLKSAPPLPSDAPYQRVVVINLSPAVSSSDPTFKDILDGVETLGGYAAHNINWPYYAQKIYELIASIKDQIDDDDDLAFIEGIEEKADEYVKKGNKNVKDFDKAKKEEGRRSRARSRSSSNLYEERSNRSRSPKRDRDRAREEGEDRERGRGRTKLVRTISKESILPYLELVKNKLNAIWQELYKSFPTSEGGFSAKGRAHDIETRDTSADGYEADASWIGKTIYKKQKKVADDASKPVYGKVSNPKVKDSDKQAWIVELEKDGINKNLKAQEDVVYKNTPAKKDRDGGQAINMGNTNASAYAMLTNTAGWKSSRWEWLHIRASSLGGATDGTNLVMGTRDTNTQMMPFEANIKTIATLIGKSATYDRIEADYTFSGQKAPARHKVTEICLAWRIYKVGEAEPVLEGWFNFDPLNTGSSISKKEVEILETGLKNVRDSLT